MILVDGKVSAISCTQFFFFCIPNTRIVNNVFIFIYMSPVTLIVSSAYFVLLFFFHFFVLSFFGNLNEKQTVSFFGDSHVAMPLQEAKLSTILRLRFRSHQTNSLLFLAAGRTDYCLLSLEDGRIKFNLKINDRLTEVNLIKNEQ